MTLLRNCVKEVMRLYTPTGGTSRTVAEDVVLLGYQVPAGVSCGKPEFRLPASASG